MKNLTILIFIFFCSFQVKAQSGQAIYAEIGGASLFYSVNYDTRFSKSENKFGARIGVSIFDDFLSIPLHLNYLFGKGNHKLEVGAGITAFLQSNEVIPSGALMYRFQKLAFNS